MSDTILGGKLTVYYFADNRRKQIRWTGATDKDDFQKMIDVYDAAEDLFSIPAQSDDGVIFSAETPGEYTVGKIDAGETEPWFIDLTTMEHIIGDFANFTGCAVKTSGWTRVQDSNTGIIVIPVTGGGTIVAADIGNDIDHDTDNDLGTLLDVVDTGGAIDYLFVRPDSDAAANNFDTGSGTLNCNGNTATQDDVAHTGEMVWGNAYTQGALKSDTHIFIFQDGTKVTRVEATDQDWWEDGHMDRAVPITDYKTSAFPIIDLGYLTVKANQYGSKYTYAIIRMNTTSGGNVSAGLSSGDSSTNVTGYKSVTFSGDNWVAGWTVGDEFSGDGSGARGIITQIDSPGSTQTLHYYLVGDPLTDFTADENVTNEDDTGTGDTDGSAPADQGPALAGWFDNAAIPTFAFTNDQVDIADSGTPQEWGITIDLNQCTLAEMHEYAKYAQMRGSALDHDGLDGEEWIGLDYAINYATITGTVNEGVEVTGATSLATGIVVSNPAGAANTALLRNSRGTFIDGERIYENDGTDEFDASGLTVEVIVPIAESSFGTITALSGGTFFGSRGVVLTDYKTTEANLFSLIDATGVTRTRPTSISMEILNLLQYDYASCFRLTGSGGDTEKDEYSATGGEAVGDPTLTVDGSIASDVPNKDNGGTLVLVDVDDDNQEYYLRFDSFIAATGVITLSNVVVTAEALTDENQIVDTGIFTAAAVKVGDLVLNKDRGDAVSYISERTSDNIIQINPPIPSQAQNDNIEINAVPVIVAGSDEVYFPIIFSFCESGQTSKNAAMQYVGDIFARVRVRNTSDAAIKIKSNTADVTIGTGGGTSSATRIPNTVYGS